MTNIFISYAYADGADIARQLVEELEAAGSPCWMGQRDLKVGEDFPPQIVRAIRECQALVVILTPGSNRSRDVLQEVHLAHNARRPMVPIVVRGTQPSDGLAYYVGIVQQINWNDARTAAATVRTVLTRSGVADVWRTDEKNPWDERSKEEHERTQSASRHGVSVSIPSQRGVFPDWRGKVISWWIVLMLTINSSLTVALIVNLSVGALVPLATVVLVVRNWRRLNSATPQLVPGIWSFLATTVAPIISVLVDGVFRLLIGVHGPGIGLVH